MNRYLALFQYHFTLESHAPYSIISYWKRLGLDSLKQTGYTPFPWTSPVVFDERLSHRLSLIAYPWESALEVVAHVRCKWKA